MLVASENGKSQTTAAGLALLGELILYKPGVTPAVAGSADVAVPELPVELAPTLAESTVEALVQEMAGSATDSRNPDRFEQAVRDAFVFLGFQAEWLGGSGRTDVLLDAMLGKEDSYRVIVDCKTSGAGSVDDHQVDWVTLSEHKVKHDADYVAVVAPNPSGSRLAERARLQGVAVFSVDQLAGLCRQHAKTPLGLDDYRSIFMQGGLVDTQAVDEAADEVRRIMALAATVCEAIRLRSSEFGRLSARDLYLLLKSDPVAEGTSEDELRDLLGTLASPLLNMLDGSLEQGYRITTSIDVSRLRLDVIARQLDRQPAALPNSAPTR
jgi:hypothetical protein